VLFRSIGTETSKGTKVFSVVGKVKNTGLVEVPMGITLREIVFDIGGGIIDDKKFKAVQTGGPSGGCIPESLLDLPIDYEKLAEVGSIMGSGGLIVMDEDTCMVDIARYFLEFLKDESCGKCTACREGIDVMHGILVRICKGEGTEGDIEQLEELAEAIKDASLCALGGTAPNPVLSTIRYFRDEYQSHIKDKSCPAGVCKALIAFSIDPEKCKGCRLCAKNCPQEAITGQVKEPHTIDQDKCIKCGVCADVCKFDAVLVA
jgi:NADH:ubiquinone oxidoreductase subunit F (NADH-binding)/Pyruvate/2-oxoacid:ferredoxin oxidoreductase delta subunit